MYNVKCYTGKTKTLKQTKTRFRTWKERIHVSVLTTLSMPQLAYELLPTTSEVILELDKDLVGIY